MRRVMMKVKTSRFLKRKPRCPKGWRLLLIGTERRHHLLRNCMITCPKGWRFADLDLLKELGLNSDIEAMLGHLKMPRLLTMAYPTYKDVSCQFLSSFEVTYHDTQHVRQGWGKIKFTIHGRVLNMSFKDIGRVMGFHDLEDSILPKCEDLPKELWKLITGNNHCTESDKNSYIWHPSVRYLHKMLVHAFYPRKQLGNYTEEDLRLLCPAITPYAAPGVLPLPSHDIYATFGMVSFFVSHLEHYRDWPAGPSFIDATYLRIATYFSGRHGRSYVYYYYLQGQPAEVLFPNRTLTSLERPGAISFNIAQENFFRDHGSLEPLAAQKRRSAATRHDALATSSSAATDEPVYGPPRYYFKPFDGVLPPGALHAHDHISRLRRWKKAQDRTIEKLKEKFKVLSKTVKRQGHPSVERHLPSEINRHFSLNIN
ncbi:hypothetical protein Bca4012_010355 [Brassica carinata]